MTKKQASDYKNISQYIGAIFSALGLSLKEESAISGLWYATDLMGNLNLGSPETLVRLTAEEIFYSFRSGEKVEALAEKLIKKFHAAQRKSDG